MGGGGERGIGVFVRGVTAVNGPGMVICYEILGGVYCTYNTVLRKWGCGGMV